MVIDIARLLLVQIYRPMLKYHKVLLIALTANVMHGDREKSLQAGDERGMLISGYKFRPVLSRGA